MIQIEKSTFGEDWKEFLNHKFCADVQFIVEGKSLEAHKAILCCASSLFRKLFNLILTEDEETTIHLENLSDYGVDYIQEDKKSRKTVITMNKNMKITVFQRVLEFIYSGVVTINEKNVHVDDIKIVAKMFHLEELETICQIRMSGTYSLNPIIDATQQFNRKKQILQSYYFFKTNLYQTCHSF